MAFEAGTSVVTHAGSTSRGPRLGVIEEVLRGEPSPRYRVRWEDGRESVYTPASGALRARRDGAARHREAPRAQAPEGGRPVRTVAIEEHCLTPELREVLGPQIHPYYPIHSWPPALEARLADIGEGRHRRDGRGRHRRAGALDRAARPRARRGRARDPGRARVQRHGSPRRSPRTRPASRASPRCRPPTRGRRRPPSSSAPSASSAWSARWSTAARSSASSTTQFFWPIFESAEALGVPIYLHPMPPPKAVYDAYYAGFGDDVGFMLGAGAWGWHIETGLHALRLILAGVFDRFPGAAGDHRPHGRGAAVHDRAHVGRARRRERARHASRTASSCPSRTTSSATSTSRRAASSPTRRCAARST